MKITVDYNDGLAKTFLPCITYDMSQKEYDASLMVMAASVVAACASKLGDEDEEVTEVSLNAIFGCARMLNEQEQYEE